MIGTNTTYYISIFVLVLTCLYAFAYAGISGLLFTAAVAMIVHSFVDSFELVAAAAVIGSMFYIHVLKRHMRERFQDTPAQVSARLGAIQNKKKEAFEPTGVYHPMTEGFEDVQPQADKDGASAQSSSAPTSATDKNQVNAEAVEKQELASATGTLFKNGQMPSEHEVGPKLDAGKTIMKAMEAFDSDTVSSMTTDTKDLLKTQKKLMEMLTQMRPVLADGKELLQTFSGMFGGSGMPFSLK